LADLISRLIYPGRHGTISDAPGVLAAIGCSLAAGLAAGGSGAVNLVFELAGRTDSPARVVAAIDETSNAGPSLLSSAATPQRRPTSLRRAFHRNFCGNFLQRLRACAAGLPVQPAEPAAVGLTTTQS